VIGTDFYTVKAELPSGQAIVPGQGQTVNVAGVKVGEGGLGEARGRHRRHRHEHSGEVPADLPGRSVLLRPKTGLKDMYLAPRPGHADGGRPPRGRPRAEWPNTLPDVNSDEIPRGARRRHARVPADPVERGRHGVRRQVTGADKRYSQTAAQDLRETFKRFEPTARYGAQITRQLADRRQNLRHVIHNFQELSTALAHRDRQLAGLVDSANANFQAFASQESALREAVRLFPGALEQTRQTLTKTSSLAAELGPALERLRPFARELAPALRKTQPFFRDTTPIIRDQIRPFARDVQPTVRDLRSATNDLAVVTPRLSRTLRRAEPLLQHARLRPARTATPVQLLGRVGVAQRRDDVRPQDAQGPIRASIVLVNCGNYNVLEQVILGNPQLGLLPRS
jgi:phospholipid/cholesterol/gamma-HCH transport system substrate-binding protein